MSENKHEVPLADRKKVSKLYPSIPEAERKGVQQNYNVAYGNVLEPMTGSERRLNVNKPSLRGKGESDE